MANDKPDPLMESLMALAVSAAPLIKRARESGMFKANVRDEAVVVADVCPAPDAEAADFASQKSALQDIIVSQAIKIAALEAEITRLKTVKAKQGK